MFHLIGFSKCIQTVGLLAQLEGNEVRNLNSLDLGYRRFLIKLQGLLPECEATGTELIDGEEAARYAKVFNVNLAREGISHLVARATTFEKPEVVIADQLRRLEAVDVYLATLFRLVVKIIICGRSEWAVGGTTSGAVGVVWINAAPDWTDRDYQELFVHELTHTLMFLDELRFGHYVDLEQLMIPSNFAKSAILQASRPLDRVLHSIVVATEVLAFRMRVGVTEKSAVHPASEPLHLQTIQATRALLEGKSYQGLLTPRAFELLELCYNQLTADETVALPL